MVEVLHDTIIAIWEVVMLIPMPWRMGLTIGIAIIIVYWLMSRPFLGLTRLLIRLLAGSVSLIISILLFLEYIVTSVLRKIGLKPLPGTHFFGGILVGIEKFVQSGRNKLTSGKPPRLKKRWIFFGASLPILLWYIRPTLDEIAVARYIDNGIYQWYSFEGWVMNGNWEPFSQVEHPRDVTQFIFPNPTSTRTPTPISNAKPTPASTFPIPVSQKKFLISFMIDQISEEKDGIKFHVSIKRTESGSLKWYSDEGNLKSIFLKDSNGKTYRAIDVGGVFATDTTLRLGQTYRGWILFRKPSKQQFTFNYPEMEPTLIRLKQ